MRLRASQLHGTFWCLVGKRVRAKERWKSQHDNESANASSDSRSARRPSRPGQARIVETDPPSPPLLDRQFPSWPPSQADSRQTQSSDLLGLLGCFFYNFQCVSTASSAPTASGARPHPAILHCHLPPPSGPSNSQSQLRALLIKEELVRQAAPTLRAGDIFRRILQSLRALPCCCVRFAGAQLLVLSLLSAPSRLSPPAAVPLFH